MENLNAYEHEKYQKGNVPPANFFNLICIYALVTAKVTILLISEPFIAIWYTLSGIFKKRSGEEKNISGQVALVTGSANGLGRAIAFRLAQENCNIAVADINLADAQRTAREISEVHRVKAVAYKVDVSDVSSIKKLKSDIESSLGHVDILVNNAGIITVASLRECTDEHIQKIIDVNLTSHFWTVRIFLDGMIERKRGRIVAISSMSAKLSIPLGIIYSTTKASVRSFMNCLYEEMFYNGHEKYIRLTTIFPGFIATRRELTDFLDKTVELSPRLTPEEVADETVRGMLKNKRDVTLPLSMGIFAALLNILPPRTFILLKTKLLPLTSLVDVQSKMRIENSKMK